jgi:hypothetical protein
MGAIDLALIEWPWFLRTGSGAQAAGSWAPLVSRAGSSPVRHGWFWASQRRIGPALPDPAHAVFFFRKNLLIFFNRSVSL